MHTIFRTTSLYKQCQHVLVLKLLVSNFKGLALLRISSIKAAGNVLRLENEENRANKPLSFCRSYAFAIVACVELPTTW